MTDYEFKLPLNEHIARRLRYLIQTEHDGSYASFFTQIYQESPSDSRLMLFKAYVDAGNINGMFMNMLAEKTKIGQVSFSRFFDVYVDNAELFGD
ncbi:hypothetical protein [Alteromonas sp. a30]|uniref:hypothetical protein n=1 Tax=Alteromonas sp. a30 TaxID=2730917 RepID=UPI00228099DA|nr:hypothetical protein [Alteromonas sp. a30]MCY7297211.1 hypothetical protein [Alteromonas sp. a30]